MAISKEQWEAMVPGKVKIIDGEGREWEVVEKIKDAQYPSYQLRAGPGPPDRYMFVPDAIYDTPGIVDKSRTWVYSLNLPQAKIISVKD